MTYYIDPLCNVLFHHLDIFDCERLLIDEERVELVVRLCLSMCVLVISS